MARDLNHCQFIGRLGKDIELKYMPNGNAVANFSIACSDDYKDKSGQKVEQTNWINIVAFGKLAEIMGQYLSKGSQIFVSGKLTVRKWQGQDGQDRYTTEIVASEMQMLSSKSDGQSNQVGSSGNTGPSKPQQVASNQPNTPQNSGAGGFEDFSDDVPFNQISSKVYF